MHTIRYYIISPLISYVRSQFGLDKSSRFQKIFPYFWCIQIICVTCIIIYILYIYISHFPIKYHSHLFSKCSDRYLMQGRKSSIDRLLFGAMECNYKVQLKWWYSATCMVQQAIKRPVMARPLQWVCWKAACVSSRGFPSIGLSDGLWLPAICTD